MNSIVCRFTAAALFGLICASAKDVCSGWESETPVMYLPIFMSPVIELTVFIRTADEEKDLQFIDTLLPDLPLVADGQLYCFETGGNPSKTFTLKHSQDAANAVCVSDVKYLVRQTSSTFSLI